MFREILCFPSTATCNNYRRPDMEHFYNIIRHNGLQITGNVSLTHMYGYAHPLIYDAIEHLQVTTKMPITFQL